MTESNDYIRGISLATGLGYGTCVELLSKGWSYHEPKGETPVWLAPIKDTSFFGKIPEGTT